MLIDSSRALFQNEKDEILTVRSERQCELLVSQRHVSLPLSQLLKRRYKIYAEAFSASFYLKEMTLLFAKQYLEILQFPGIK